MNKATCIGQWFVKENEVNNNGRKVESSGWYSLFNRLFKLLNKPIDALHKLLHSHNSENTLGDSIIQIGSPLLIEILKIENSWLS